MVKVCFVKRKRSCIDCGDFYVLIGERRGSWKLLEEILGEESDRGEKDKELDLGGVVRLE